MVETWQRSVHTHVPGQVHATGQHPAAGIGLSRTVKCLMFYLTGKLKSRRPQFMDADRRHMTFGSGTKDLITHVTASSSMSGSIFVTVFFGQSLRGAM